MLHTPISPDASVDRWRLVVLRAGMIFLIVLISCSKSSAYSVLAHERYVQSSDFVAELVQRSKER